MRPQIWRTSILVPLIFIGCASGYWPSSERTSAWNCPVNAAPLYGAPSKAIRPTDPSSRDYHLTNALIRSCGGNRLKATEVRFNGATGAFESADMKGYMLTDELVAMPSPARVTTSPPNMPTRREIDSSWRKGIWRGATQPSVGAKSVRSGTSLVTGPSRPVP